MLEIPIYRTANGLVADTGRGLRREGSGLLIAHDIVDHPLEPHADLVVDEVMALGGSLVRLGVDHKSSHAMQKVIGEAAKACIGDNCIPGYGGSRDEELIAWLFPRVGLVVREEEMAWDVSGWIGEGYRRARERFPGEREAERLHERVWEECIRFQDKGWKGGVIRIEGGEVEVKRVPRG